MMETIEYRTVDKSGWERGPWDHEPDKKQWRDEATGLPCLIVRNDFGALCGYVGVPPGHPWHGRHFDDLDVYPSVHRGVNFAGGCVHSDDPSRGVCHVPGVGEGDDVWWIGFDCAHSRDKWDMNQPAEIRVRLAALGGVYRDIAYVERECASLAEQAVSLA